jgi:NAD(P)-dependent dehydrogenase (short-subunit alcohol dehydrogenase family)
MRGSSRGIASVTIIAARELDRYGVTANAVSPGALTRMTENLNPSRARPEVKDGEFNPRSPDNVAPVVVWLGSLESASVTGRVFEAHGGRIGIAEGWRRGPSISRDRRWEPDEIGAVVHDLLAKAAPVTGMGQ